MIVAGYVMDTFGGRSPGRFAMHIAAFGGAAAIPCALAAGMSTDVTICLAGLGGFVFFMALPTTIAPFIIQLFVPNELRGMSTALYVMIANLTGYGLGPSTAALLADQMPAAHHHIGSAMAIMAAVLLPGAVLLFVRAGHKLTRRLDEDPLR